MAIKTAEIPVSYPYLSVQYIYIVEIFTWDYPPPPVWKHLSAAWEFCTFWGKLPAQVTQPEVP